MQQNFAIRKGVAWYRALPDNPIYKRESGAWGNPNPIYDVVVRYSPFVFLTALLVAFCGGVTNPVWLSRSNGFSLFCILGVTANILKLYGIVAAPALTVPCIGLEQSSGSLELLFTTPKSRQDIVFAKFFGALSRLKIWKPMLFFGGLQMLAASIPIAEAIRDVKNMWLLLTLPAYLAQPFLEVFFAGLLGLYLSTWIKSSMMAIVATYAAFFTLKILFWIMSIFFNSIYLLNDFTALGLLFQLDLAIQFVIATILLALTWRRVTIFSLE